MRKLEKHRDELNERVEKLRNNAKNTNSRYKMNIYVFLANKAEKEARLLTNKLLEI